MLRSATICVPWARLALLLSVGAGAAVAQGHPASKLKKLTPFVVAEQGSFSVGGHTVQGAGVFDPTKSPAATNEGQTFWVDQLYAQFQIPVDPRRYPLVLVHGGAGTGRVWESTPDGREGYQTIFLRRGFAVYIVDFPHRGRAGFPTFNGNLGNLDGVQIVPDVTSATGVQFGWTRWRIGPAFPQILPVQQFPADQASLDQFFQALVAIVSDNATVISDALVALLDKIGPAIVVTHSQSGLFGWLTAIRRPNLVKAVVSYEPGFVFPQGAAADPALPGGNEGGRRGAARRFRQADADAAPSRLRRQHPHGPDSGPGGRRAASASDRLSSLPGGSQPQRRRRRNPALA